MSRTFPGGLFARTCLAPVFDLLPSVCDREFQLASAEGFSIDTPDLYCHRCGETVGPHIRTDRSCPLCSKQTITWDHIVRLAPYTHPMSDWIVSMKFANQWSWGEWLGERLAEVIDDDSPKRIAVCPVPMHPLRQLARGYNQASIIARIISKRHGWPTEKLLRRVKLTPRQATLAPSQRIDNVKNAFRAKRIDLTGWTIWLVDDVKTTGSTLTTCTKLLKQSGAEKVNVAVAGVAHPRGSKFEIRTG